MSVPDISNHKLTLTLKWGLGMLGAVLISPIVFLAVKGLVGLGICIALAMAGYKFFPAASLWMSNLALKAFKQAAASNPVETLQNILIEKTKEYDDQNNALTKFDGKVRTFDDKKDKLASRFPTEAAKFQQMSSNMHGFLEEWKKKQKHAFTALQETKAELEKAEAVWEVALAGQEVAALSKKAKARIYQEVAAQVAVDSITNKLNQAFASLDQMSRQQDMEFNTTPSLDGTSAAALAQGEPIMIEGIRTPERQTVPVRRKP